MCVSISKFIRRRSETRLLRSWWMIKTLVSNNRVHTHIFCSKFFLYFLIFIHVKEYISICQPHAVADAIEGQSFMITYTHEICAIEFKDLSVWFVAFYGSFCFPKSQSLSNLVVCQSTHTLSFCCLLF